MPQKGKMRKYNQRMTAENMPQKGKMRKIQPADDCGKYATERENEKTMTNSRLRQNAAVRENEGERKTGSWKSPA